MAIKSMFRLFMISNMRLLPIMPSRNMQGKNHWPKCVYLFLDEIVPKFPRYVIYLQRYSECFGHVVPCCIVC